jgi:hypothetical protein
MSKASERMLELAGVEEPLLTEAKVTGGPKKALKSLIKIQDQLEHEILIQLDQGPQFPDRFWKRYNKVLDVMSQLVSDVENQKM